MLSQTLIALNRQSPQVAGDLADIKKMHARVMSLFGGEPTRTEFGRELWANPIPGRVLIQHPGGIDPRWLPNGYATAISTQPARIHWAPGTHIRWSVLANPTKDTRRGMPEAAPDGGTWTAWEATHGRDYRKKYRAREPLQGEQEIRYWLDRKFAGLAISSVEFGNRRTTSGRKPERRITIWRIHITGTGIVGDTDAWARVLSHGVGDGKAYGCGLVVCGEIGQ